MTTTTQQIPSDPARDFANAILAETNDARDLLDLLHEIAQGNYDATTNDQITANKVLMDRGLGKCPKQSPAADPTPDSEETAHGQAETLPAPAPSSHAPQSANEPESPRIVTQISDSLNDSLGPAPSACPEPSRRAHTPTHDSPEQPAPYSMRGGNPESPGPFEPSSIQSSIQDYILTITNHGQTLRAALIGIAFADPDDLGIIPYHRNRAAIILLDRSAGKDPTPNTTVVQARPEPSQSVPHNPEYPPGYILDPTKDCIDCSPTLGMFEGHEGEHRFDEEAWAEAMEKLQQMVDEHGITPDPNAPKIDWSIYEPPEDWVPHPDEVRKEAAAFEAEIKLRIERQKNWPKIEERRRKKLAQIYPSHSEDDDKTPDT